MSAAKPATTSGNVAWACQRSMTMRARRVWIGNRPEAFEQDLQRLLYKIRNRMSGSYFPPPVKAAVIGEEEWRVRILAFGL